MVWAQRSWDTRLLWHRSLWVHRQWMEKADSSCPTDPFLGLLSYLPPLTPLNGPHTNHPIITQFCGNLASWSLFFCLYRFVSCSRIVLLNFFTGSFFKLLKFRNYARAPDHMTLVVCAMSCNWLYYTTLRNIKQIIISCQFTKLLWCYVVYWIMHRKVEWGTFVP